MTMATLSRSCSSMCKRVPHVLRSISASSIHHAAKVEEDAVSSQAVIQQQRQTHVQFRRRKGAGAWRQRQRRRVPHRSERQRKKIWFQSLGCPRNWVDTEIMMGLATANDNPRFGLEVTPDAHDADYLVVNTCGFLESARQESSQAIRDLLELKRQQEQPSSSVNNNKKLLVTGCMVNLHKEQILKDYPEVDAVLSSGAIDKIVETIQHLEEEGSKHTVNTDNGASIDADFATKPSHVEENATSETLSTSTTESPSSSSPPSSAASSSLRRSFLEQGDTPRFLATPPHFAYLKIAEGCKKRCSFCIIPKIKGPLQSKPITQVVEEFQALLEASPTLREVILIAQDLGDFGKDFNAGRDNNNKSHLTALLRAMLQSTDDPDLWLRLLYLYPDEITPDLVELMQSDTRIVRYLDLPIQHSHNDILRKMRRKTSSQDIIDTLDMLRNQLPGIVLRTSLMVGFPGETDEHFEDLLQFVRDQELDHVGVFCYSNESQALSSRLPGHVPEDVKQERYGRLMEAQYEIVQRRNAAAVGQHYAMVVEGLNEQQQIIGRHYGQCPDIDNHVILEEDPQQQLGRGQHRGPQIVAGQRYKVEITGSNDGYDLVGRVVAAL